MVDINSSHLLNPDWDSHARVHEAWRLSTNLFIFLLAIFLLWSKGQEILASLLSLCIHLGFVISALLMPFYGGKPIGEGIPEPEIINIPLNMLIFFFLFFLQSFVLLLLLRERINSKGYE